MADKLETAAKELVRSYRMNWDALAKIKRQEHSLGVSVELSAKTGAPTYTLFNASTQDLVGRFSEIEWAEILILREASKVYGSVITADEAAAQYEVLLNQAGAGS
jgi:hypothetical protein